MKKIIAHTRFMAAGFTYQICEDIENSFYHKEIAYWASPDYKLDDLIVFMHEDGYVIVDYQTDKEIKGDLNVKDGNELYEEIWDILTDIREERENAYFERRLPNPFEAINRPFKNKTK